MEVEEALAAADTDTRDYINSIQGVRRHAKTLRRKILENEERRLKHADAPELFVESEVALDEEVKLFNALAAHPELLEPFRECGGSTTLISLLGHSNPDIALSALSILQDISDPEVMSDSTKAGAKSFVEHLIEDFDITELLYSLLQRLNEDDDQDFEGVGNVLQTLDNCREALPEAVIAELLRTEKLLHWLLNRLQGPKSKAPEDEDIVDYNRLYCTELLCSILQMSSDARQKLGRPISKGGFDGIEKLLLAFAKYKKRDWSSPEEKEYVLNLKDCLYSLLLDSTENREYFAKAEGMHLMVRILKEHTRVWPYALQLIDVALMDRPDQAAIFVRAGGLAHLFPLLLSLGVPKAERKRKSLETTLNVMVQLAEQCTGDEQVRFLNKFFENDCEKLKALVSLHTVLYTEDLATQKIVHDEYGWNAAADYSDKNAIPLVRRRAASISVTMLFRRNMMAVRYPTWKSISTRKEAMLDLLRFNAWTEFFYVC